VLFIPSLLSFPLAASLLEGGASLSVVVAFITTLTMIGTVTLPLEIRELGKKMALLRSGMSFIIAIVIALIMGAIL
ncbi:MAG TPA: permease, partial [Euryarchaeota archaeon]|nr:permease [Euryarchaeota archaeon]